MFKYSITIWFCTSASPRLISLLSTAKGESEWLYVLDLRSALTHR